MPPAFCGDPGPHIGRMVAEMADVLMNDMKVCVCKDGCNFSVLQLAHFRPVEFAPVQPSRFGPVLWALLHCCAKKLPPRARHVLYALQYMLPCLQCQKHLQEECRMQPELLHATHPDNVEKQMYDLHNRVNRRKEEDTAKKENRELQYVDRGEEVLSEYKHMCKNFDAVFQVIEQQWHYRCNDSHENTEEQLVECLRSKICYMVLSDAVRDLLALSTAPLSF